MPIDSIAADSKAQCPASVASDIADKQKEDNKRLKHDEAIIAAEQLRLDVERAKGLVALAKALSDTLADTKLPEDVRTLLVRSMQTAITQLYPERGSEGENK